MQIHLNRIDGLDDAICTLFLSKRHLTREKELEIRRQVAEHVRPFSEGDAPIGAFMPEMGETLDKWIDNLLKYGRQHMTMLRFIDLSFSVYGLHRGGQDDVDAHNYRFNNRIIRASTRLGTFQSGEMSEWYQGKILPTDVALAALGIELPDELEHDGKIYVRACNGYIEKGHENDNDYKRGLYMLSIPSDFLFKIQLTEYAHVWKLRNKWGTANPEVKIAIESGTDQLEAASNGRFDRELLKAIPN